MGGRLVQQMALMAALLLASAGLTPVTSAVAVAPTECVVVTDVRDRRLYLGQPSPDQRAAADALERWVRQHDDQVAGSDWCSSQTALQVWVLPGVMLAKEIAALADQHGVPIAVSSAPRSARDLQSAHATAIATLNETALGIVRVATNPATGSLRVDLQMDGSGDLSVISRAAQISAAVSVPVVIHLLPIPDGSPSPVSAAAPGPVPPSGGGCPVIRDPQGRPWYPEQIPAGLVALDRDLTEVAQAYPVEVVTLARCSTLTGVQVWLTQRAGAKVRAALAEVATRHPDLDVLVSVAPAAGSAEQLWPRDPTPLTMVGLVGFERDPTRLVAVAWLDRDSPELLTQATALVSAWKRSVPLEVRAITLTDGPVIKAVPAPTSSPAEAPPEPTPTPAPAAPPLPRPPTWLIGVLAALGWLGVLRLAGLGVRVSPTTEVEASEELNALETWRSGFEDFDPD